jgi:hypothetical protein
MRVLIPRRPHRHGEVPEGGLFSAVVPREATGYRLEEIEVGVPDLVGWTAKVEGLS